VAPPPILQCGRPGLAWRAIRAVKSNAILLVKGGASVGVGMGQVNRVDSCHLAVTRAGVDRAAGSVAASDAYSRSPMGSRCCWTPAFGPSLPRRVHPRP